MNKHKFLSNKLVQLITFQIQWFCCVLSVKPYFRYGYLVSVLVWLVTLVFQRTGIKKILFIFILAVIGISNDSVLGYFEVYRFQNLLVDVVVPTWLIILWLCFCTWYANANWINKKYFLFSLLGMVGGPLSYFAGTKLLALKFSQSISVSLVIISIDWLLLCLFFTYLNQNLFKSLKNSN